MAKTMKKHSKRNASRKKKMHGGFPTPTTPAATSATFEYGPGAEGAAPYVEARYGDVNQQYNDVFDINSKTLGNSFTKLPDSQIPNPQSLALVQSAGKRRHRMKGRKHKKGGMEVPLGGKKHHRKGGNVFENNQGGSVMAGVETAVVPFGLLAAHNKYGKKSKKGGKKHKKSRKTKKHHKKSKKGGMMGQLLSTAAVPFTLLGAQNMFGKKSKKSKKSRK